MNKYYIIVLILNNGCIIAWILDQIFMFYNKVNSVAG